jgi:hypothetical protein
LVSIQQDTFYKLSRQLKPWHIKNNKQKTLLF